MTPDLNHSISVHNKTMQKWWAFPDYIHERQEFVRRNPLCIRCGRPAVTPGHSQEDYILYERYLNAVKTDKCDPLCSACNLMERKNLHPCPSCVNQYHLGKKNKIKYISQDAEVCYDCRPEKEKQATEKKGKEFKKFVRKVQDEQNKKRRKFYRMVKKNGR
jgi:hypothetical protein